MRKNLVYIVGTIVSVPMFAVAIFLFLTTADAHATPTPTRIVVGGVFGMMAALIILVMGFLTAVQASD